jgi:DnaK suppressor protein
MLTKEQRDTIEKRLLREREAVLELLAEFEEGTDDLREQSGELSLYRFHMADVGTEMMEKEKEFLLASRDGRRLYEIDEALRRLYKEPETFGLCERCGEAIEFERLELVPEARLCARCQNEVESGPAEAAGPA